MARFSRLLPTLFLALLITLTGLGCGGDEAPIRTKSGLTPEELEREVARADSISPDVPYVPTPQPVVDRMLELAEVSEDDVVYDLGSGDGRIVITAAERYGARGVGIEIEGDLVEMARQRADSADVAGRVAFRQADLFDVDLSEATVVTLYLLPSLNLKLRPRLFEQLAPGTRVVSHFFDMGAWEAEKEVEVDGAPIFMWTIPDEIPAGLQE